MQSNKRVFWALLSVGVLTLFWSSSFLWPKSALSVVAQGISVQDPTNACKALDVVIVIDQSDSMVESNDPDGRRFDAAQTIIDYLGNHAVWLCLGQDIKHRVSVIGFGDQQEENYQDDTVIYLDSQIVPPVADFDSWKDDRVEIKAEIAEGKEDQLGATDHYAAMLTAHDILDKWDENPIEGADRRQAVVIITDGEPCLLSRGCGQGNSSFYDINPDLDALRELTNPNDDTFPWRGSDNSASVFISLIALSKRDGDFQSVFFDDWGAITAGHGGSLLSANEANTNLNSIVTDVMTPIVGSGFEPQACNQEFWIEPYTNNLMLIYAFGLVDDLSQSQQALLRIETAEGELVEVQGGDASDNTIPVANYIEDHPNEFYVFSPPIPGKYVVTLPDVGGSCENDLEIRIEKRSVIAEVITPEDGSKYPAVESPDEDRGAERFRVEVFSVADDEDAELKHLVEFSDYPLEIEVEVSSKEGNYQEVIGLEKTSDGVYESELIASPITGEYSWAMSAQVDHPNPEESPIEVFTKEGEFIATEVQTLNLDLIQPGNSQLFALNTIQGTQQRPAKIPVTIELVLEEGGPIPDEVLSGLNDAELFTAELVKDGSILETITLRPEGNLSSRFSGEFDNSSGGDILSPGDYTIRVTADWQSEYYDTLAYTPGDASVDVSVSQYEVVPIKLSINPPSTLTLHKDDWQSNLLQGEELNPFDFQIEINNALTGETVELQNALLDLENPIQALIVPPSGNSHQVDLSTRTNENYQQFLGQDVGTNIAEEGEYQIKVEATDIPLREEYAWTTTTYQASFQRQDTFFTSPSTWRGVQIGLLAITLIFLGFLAYIFSGGPTGHLVVSDSNGELAQLSLSKRRRVNRISKPTLENVGIEQIKARKGYENLLSVTVKNTDGHEAPLEMEPGQVDFVGDAQIRYVNENVPTESYDDFSFD